MSAVKVTYGPWRIRSDGRRARDVRTTMREAFPRSITLVETEVEFRYTTAVRYTDHEGREHTTHIPRPPRPVEPDFSVKKEPK